MLPNNLYPLKGLMGREDPEVNTGTISDFSIAPAIYNARLVNDKYLFTFNNMCFNGSLVQPGALLNANMTILKTKLNNWIKPSDRKYIKLESCNKQTSVFSFDIDSWLEDGLKNCRPYYDNLKMTRKYKMSVQLPYMVRVYGMETVYGKYISEHFKKALSKKPELRKNVFGIIEDITTKHLKMDSLKVFEYNYDSIWNSVNVNVNPIYISGIIGATVALQKDKSWKKKINFDKSVGMYLKWH